MILGLFFSFIALLKHQLVPEVISGKILHCCSLLVGFLDATFAKNRIPRHADRMAATDTCLLTAISRTEGGSC